MNKMDDSYSYYITDQTITKDNNDILHGNNDILHGNKTYYQV
jgi:hypothetical protein